VPSPLNPNQRSSNTNATTTASSTISNNNNEAATSNAQSTAPQSTSAWLAALEEVQRGISIDEEAGPRARTISSFTSPSNLNSISSTTLSSAAAGSMLSPPSSSSFSSSAAAAAAVVSTPEEQLVQQWESMMRHQKQQFDQQNDELMERMKKTNPQLANLLIHRQKEKNAQLQLQVVQLQNKVLSTSPPKSNSSPKALETSIRTDGASGGTSGKLTAPGGFSTAPGQTPGMPVFGSSVLPAPRGWESMSPEELNDFVSKKLKAVDGHGGSSNGITHEAPSFPQAVVPIMAPPVIPLLQSFSTLSSTSTSQSLSSVSSRTTPQPLPASSSSSSSSSSSTSKLVMHSTLTAELLEEARRNGAATAAAAIAAASSSSSLASSRGISNNIPLRSSFLASVPTPLSPPLAPPPPMSSIIPGQLLQVSDVSTEDGNIGPTGVVKFIGSRVFSVPEPSDDMVKRIERGLQKAAEEDEKDAQIKDTDNATSSSSSSSSSTNQEDEEYMRGAAEVQANRVLSNAVVVVGSGGGKGGMSPRQRVLELLERSLDERCEELLASGEEPKLIERRWIFEGIKGLAETVAALRVVTQ
jgi:hypothetical protein